MRRRGGLSGRIPDRFRPNVGEDEQIALELYGVMGGLDWQALPLLLQLYDIADPERTIQHLVTIRNEMNRPRDNATK